ncbi:unnamed protein product [Linum trigynum]|uniref:Uncharacterized protein n=1 Tax=Linum trigynum TaxID=586398 RepID=A0AAV2DYI5_9ROSI
MFSISPSPMNGVMITNSPHISPPPTGDVVIENSGEGEDVIDRHLLTGDQRHKAVRPGRWQGRRRREKKGHRWQWRRKLVATTLRDREGRHLIIQIGSQQGQRLNSAYAIATPPPQQ